MPTSFSIITIDRPVTFNQDFTVSGSTNGKTAGSMTITSAGSLTENPLTPTQHFTLTIDHGILTIDAVANRSVPRLNVSVLGVNYTQRGIFVAKANIGANSTVNVNCLMLGNQGGIELGSNAMLNIAANIDVATGNGSIVGTSSSSQPAEARIAGVFTGINGGTRNVFSGNLKWCMVGGEFSSCIPTGPVQTPPAGGDPACRPLPVTLVSFTAQAQPTSVKLNWATATELNNAYFEVQRSPDGQAFAALGRVQGAGTTSTGAAYSFTDARPLTGAAYYRLRQVDHDGTEAFSAVAAVTSSSKPEATFFPNPGSTAITLPSGAGQLIEYRIYTTTGRTILTGRVAGGTSLDVQQIPVGLYLLELSTDGQRNVQRFVRQ
ncbi:T9SS type A sorting domain-containing protein [Hymenobacter amundsenii]|uniref:T9SS type A sorting domain-containing protein n=1 Tax=Hymenobacter amundsenii TaxID=2006685 RepID=UPI0013FD9B60|nr:T9SS type A sorting domain-containing protein [Hymenobacter amundsenii]